MEGVRGGRGLRSSAPPARVSGFALPASELESPSFLPDCGGFLVIPLLPPCFTSSDSLVLK